MYHVWLPTSARGVLSSSGFLMISPLFWCRQTQMGPSFSNGGPGLIAPLTQQQPPPGLQGPLPPLPHFSSHAPGLSQPSPGVGLDFGGPGSLPNHHMVQQGPPPGVPATVESPSLWKILNSAFPGHLVALGFTYLREVVDLSRVMISASYFWRSKPLALSHCQLPCISTTNDRLVT